ncbi:hypothetical protein V8E36_004205 [Tilletia maclaganii]
MPNAMREQAEENHAATPEGFNDQLRQTRMALALLELAFGKINNLTERPLEAFLRANPPDLRMNNRMGELATRIADFHEQVKAIHVQLSEGLVKLHEVVEAWVAVLKLLACQWESRIWMQTQGVDEITLYDVDADWTRVENFIERTDTPPRSSALFAHQALTAELAFREMTRMIEHQFLHNTVQHAKSMNHTVRASRSVYRNLPLGGCTTIPATIWCMVFQHETLMKLLACSGNPLVVFQCVQDWIENGEGAALPQMLARLSMEEADICSGKQEWVGPEEERFQTLWRVRPQIDDGAAIREVDDSEEASRRSATEANVAMLPRARASPGAEQARAPLVRTAPPIKPIAAPRKPRAGLADITNTSSTAANPASPETHSGAKAKLGRSPLSQFVHTATEDESFQGGDGAGDQTLGAGNEQQGGNKVMSARHSVSSSTASRTRSVTAETMIPRPLPDLRLLHYPINKRVLYAARPSL